MRFIQFGCWNQLKEREKCDKLNPSGNPLSKVMTVLNEYTREWSNIDDFIIVSGDNYYPGKETTKYKTGTVFNGEVLTEDLKIKKKKIYIEDLESGFNCLPTNIEIDMILGNHDLETQKIKKPTLYLEDDTLETRGSCIILNTENELSKRLPNVNFGLFITKYDTVSKTLILMIDTSIYDEDDWSEYLPCYKYLVDRNAAESDEDYKERIRSFQKDKIMNEIIKHEPDGIMNIIISGHHPISGYKLKIGDEKNISNIKENKFVILGNNLIPFIHLLKEIYQQVNDIRVRYYYLCADLHLYQQGKIELNIDSENAMLIEQYIVGTGGTELDPNPFNVQYYGVRGRIPIEIVNEIEFRIIPSSNDKYRMRRNDIEISKNNYGYGFIECILNAEQPPSFNFILVSPMEGGRMKRVSKINKKKNKTYKKTYKKTYNKKNNKKKKTNKKRRISNRQRN